MFIKPCDGRITSGFRTKERPDHNGVDIAQAGTVEIKAAAAGRVLRSYVSQSYGEVIFIVHNIGGQQWETVFAHMRSGSRRFKEGQQVAQGQVIGLMGNTGQSQGQHLHFELHKGLWNINKTNAVNPLTYFETPASQIKEEEEMLEKAIVVGDHPDLSAAEVLQAKTGAPIYFKPAIVGKKVAKELFIVGGNKEGLVADKFTVLAGADRRVTMNAVFDYKG